MGKEQTHYLPNGKVYTGPTHKAGGVLMTGAKHTPQSKKLTHTQPKKKMQYGGSVTTGTMPPNNAQQQKQQLGGSMTPGMMKKGGMPKKKAMPKGPAVMIAIAIPAKKGKKRATTKKA